MNNFPTRFDHATEPLNPREFNNGTYVAAIANLADKGYEVHIGLTPEYADAISKMCLESSIREYCPNDAGGRFSDRAATERWLSKGRATFLLLKKDDGLRLAGYGWAGGSTSSHVPGGQTTFAIRIGQADQGQGLATPYAQLIVGGAAIVYGAKDFWLETWASDAAAVHVYHKIGFIDVDQAAAGRPSAGGETVPDTRLYMSLPD
jgi:RimJ/RimL family protein N-acetyltransferase